MVEKRWALLEEAPRTPKEYFEQIDALEPGEVGVSVEDLRGAIHYAECYRQKFPTAGVEGLPDRLRALLPPEEPELKSQERQMEWTGNEIVFADNASQGVAGISPDMPEELGEQIVAAWNYCVSMRASTNRHAGELEAVVHDFTHPKCPKHNRPMELHHRPKGYRYACSISGSTRCFDGPWKDSREDAAAQARLDGGCR